MRKAAEYFRDPDAFLATYREKSAVRRKQMMRRIGAHAEELITADPKDGTVTRRVLRFADHCCDLAGEEEPCLHGYAFRLECVRLRRVGDLQGADEMIALGLRQADKDRCLYCRAHSFLLMSNLIRSLTLAAKADDFAPALAFAEESRGLYAELRRQATGRLREALSCCEGTVSFDEGQAHYFAESYDEAARCFREAMALTAPERGRSSRWFCRNAPCPSLPTDEIRANVHESALFNLAKTLSKTGDPEARREARATVELLLLKVPPRTIVEGRLLWFSAELEVDVWAATSGDAKDASRRLAESRMKKAFHRMLVHGSPVDVVACLCDWVALPWHRNAAMTAESIFEDLSDTYRSHLERQVEQMKRQQPRLAKEFRRLPTLIELRADGVVRLVATMRGMTLRSGALPRIKR